MRKLVVVVALLACGKSKSEPSNQGPEEPAQITNEQLAAVPLVNVSNTTGAVAFAIDLPISVLDPPEIAGQIISWARHGGSPSFTVAYANFPLSDDPTATDPPPSSDPKARRIVRHEKLADGGNLTLEDRPDHSYFNVEVCRAHASGHICCEARYVDEAGTMQSFDALVAQAEKVCRSMKAK